MLAWGLQYGCAVIPKSMTESRIKKNLETYNVQLQEEDMTALANIATKFRMFKIDGFWKEGETAEMFWDGEQ